MITAPEILIKSQHDVNVPISITLIEDCVDELIYAEVYTDLGEFVGNVNIELPSYPASEGMTVGDVAGTVVIVNCNFTLIEPNQEYGLVFKTIETGVVASFVLGIYNKNNYNFPKSCGESGTLVAYRYIPQYSDKSIDELIINWTIDDSYTFVIENMVNMHQLQINSIPYNKDAYNYNPGENFFSIKTSAVTLQNNDVITIFFYQGEPEA